MFRRLNIYYPCVVSARNIERGEKPMEMAIKQRVGAYLEGTGTTKEQLAHDLGISRGALYAKLNGTSDFTLPEAYALSQLLGCTVEDLRVPIAR